MRKFLVSALLLVSFLVVSCDQNENLTNQQEAIYKPSPYARLITLPARSPLYQDSVFTVSKEINGETGGTITYQNFYISADGDSVIMNAVLTVPEGAFTGTTTISLTFDDLYAAIDFDPSMVFLEDLNLTQSFKGLDLTGIQPETIDFVYVGPSGNSLLQPPPIENSGIDVLSAQGIVKILNAKLGHFSKYGWVR